MIGYYLILALKSLRQNVILTGLIALAIGTGVGASMTMLTIFRAVGGDPIPKMSSRLYTVQIDNQGLGDASFMPPLLTYTDALALMRARRAVRQAAMYPLSLSVIPPSSDSIPIHVTAHATYGEFFPMLGLPFEYGASWNRADDDAHAAVTVLTKALNDRLFGGTNSVGRTIDIDDRLYRVIGVTKDWRLRTEFYDWAATTRNGVYGGPDELFIPFTSAVDAGFQPSEGYGCDAHGPGSGWSGILHANCIWISFWAELPTAAAAGAYRAFLLSYAQRQRDIGRFNWPPRASIYDVMGWLRYNHIVPPAVDTLTEMSFAILGVCLLNATGLMLAKFMTRSGSVSVRRALGASRAALFSQCLVEAATIGLVGALLGMALTALGLASCRAVMPIDLAPMARSDAFDAMTAIAMALLGAMLAGLYPTWRVVRPRSMRQLKAQ